MFRRINVEINQVLMFVKGEPNEIHRLKNSIESIRERHKC